jgi:Flp pilus assembly protein TadD
LRRIWLATLLATSACATQSHDPGTYNNASLKVADVALANGAPEMALQVAQQVLAKDPTNVDALVHKGGAEFALGQTSQAAATFNNALALAPNNLPATMGLGRILLASDPQAAQAAFAKVAARSPNDWAAQADLGIALDLLGRHAEAQQAYRQALVIDSSQVGTQVNLGLSLALSGQPNDALAILKPIADHQVTSSRVRQDLAVALALSGQSDTAKTLLERDMPQQEAARTVAGYQALKLY